MNIQNSVALTRDIGQVQSEKFAYLPDTLGFVFGDGHHAWGFLVREGIPRPFQGGRSLIPCFALFGGDLKHPEQHYSLIYDRFIGHEFFDCLLGVLKHFYAVDEDAVRSRLKEAFHRAFPEADGFFPAQTMFYFSNEPKPGNEFTLVDMKRAPEWR